MLQYEIEGKIAVITGCSATDSEIEIPEYIESCPVGKIAPNSFNKISYLRHFNNNSFYYSSQKNKNYIKKYKKYKISTEVKTIKTM